MPASAPGGARTGRWDRRADHDAASAAGDGKAAVAALAGSNPIPASSGQVIRYRLNRGGDRQLNRVLRTILLVRLRTDPDTRTWMARRTAEGKSRRDAKRCLRRVVVRQLNRATLSPRIPGPQASHSGRGGNG